MEIKVGEYIRTENGIIGKAFERNDCIDWNFTDIREKYGFYDDEED